MPVNTPSGTPYLHAWKEPGRICLKLASNPRHTIKIDPEIVPEMARVMLELIKEPQMENTSETEYKKATVQEVLDARDFVIKMGGPQKAIAAITALLKFDILLDEEK